MFPRYDSSHINFRSPEDLFEDYIKGSVLTVFTPDCNGEDIDDLLQRNTQTIYIHPDFLKKIPYPEDGRKPASLDEVSLNLKSDDSKEKKESESKDLSESEVQQASQTKTGTHSTIITQPQPEVRIPTAIHSKFSMGEVGAYEKAEDFEKIFQALPPPPLPPTPLVPIPVYPIFVSGHRVNEQVWGNFMQELSAAGRKGATESDANKMAKDLTAQWNAHFFRKRGLYVVLQTPTESGEPHCRLIVSRIAAPYH